MTDYRLGGHEIHLSLSIPDLAPYEIEKEEPAAEPSPPVHVPLKLVSRAAGWLGGEDRVVEIWEAPPGVILRVPEVSDIYLSPGGKAILPIPAGGETTGERRKSDSLEREILLGPALVLALAMGGTWCLHASAAVWQGRSMAFLGESGQGKSTLAGILAAKWTPAWRLLADDILPVRISGQEITAWPHFPQLKMRVDRQPGPAWQEHLPLRSIIVLERVEPERQPMVIQLSEGEGTKILLQHTAGTRMFNPEMLAAHLSACAQGAKQATFFRLVYPHRRDTLARIKELLEKTC